MKLITGFIISAAMLLAICFLADNVWADIQQVQTPSELIEKQVTLDTYELVQSSTIHDENGKKIQTLHGTEHRTYITFEQLPPSVIHAFVAAEDNHFFEHTGIDGSAIIRAFLVNARSQSTEQGGSTITQQLARNLFLNHEKTYKRKLNEALFSYQLEKEFSKEKILELYSNAIYFGNGVYGIETASQFYFGKSVSDLTLAEIALLCGIPNSPNKYDPIKNMDTAQKRQQYVLKKMLDNQYITQAEFDKAKAKPIRLKVTRTKQLYPDYTSYVIHELKELVKVRDGFDEKIAKAATAEEKENIHAQLNEVVYNLIYDKGVKIETFLDTDLQKHAQKNIQRIPHKVEGAFVIIDHNHHKIKALIGGKQMKANEFNRAYQAYRQPGSTIKPLLSFAPYLEVTGSSISVPVNASPLCKQDYCPQNYGNAIFNTVSMKSAIGKSINTAAVRLTSQIGIDKAFEYLKPFSFQKVSDNDRHLPSVLGGFDYGMTPLELTNAYTTFSNNGNYQPSRAIKRVLSHKGEILYEWEDKPTRVWSKNTNIKMRTLLNYVMTNGTGRVATLPTPYIGGKTGTSNAIKDLWFVGITDRYTAGIWMGKDKPAPIQASQLLHLKIWKDIMQKAQP
ncbi:transglycosylase domain-containing protein [Pseudalkalibacillus sp. SCS-8]|uniref:transglycosylase domain-containing protein n=1 Tax=Pseudalkalibacillus nanhaiensis TaxID=3115291 RepID=UPI0032DA9BE2